jgi:ATP-binding cassette subfamily B protein
MSSRNWNRWLAAAADREGLELEQVFPSLVTCAEVAIAGSPSLLRIEARTVNGFLLIVGGNRRRASLLGPDLRTYSVPIDVVSAAIQERAIDRLAPSLDAIVRMPAFGHSTAEQMRRALIGDQLAHLRAGTSWLLRAAARERFRDAASQAGLPRAMVILLLTQAMQAALFLGSWWVLGRGLLQGQLDRGWLFGWVLLLMSIVPFRLAASWMQGLLAIAAGAELRRRLLQGILRIDAQQVRSKGAGQFFGLVSESAAVEALAISGGLATPLAIVELAMASFVLWAGTGWLPVALLAAWTGGIVWIAGRYLKCRRAWTDDRLTITDRFVEHMIGHRTRQIQQSATDRYNSDDDSLERYVENGIRMDRWELRLLTAAPRGWMVLGIGALLPVAAATSAGRLAVSVGGVIVAYRAFRRLTDGLADVAGAAIAGRLVEPLARAAARREPATTPSVAIPPAQEVQEGVAALARDLVVRYRPHGSPILQGCNLRVNRATRLLLEGPSGSGKTTLASTFAGLVVAESGLLLVDGLDRGVLGTAGWRARVAMAPQPHDNFLIGGSLALNLLMGRGWPASPEDLEDAEAVCRELGLGDLLHRMPAGIHQIVGETGWQLSQGERTRVFLARALLQRPDLLILDESFSALDPENIDRAVRCVTQRAPTVLAIAHA